MLERLMDFLRYLTEAEVVGALLLEVGAAVIIALFLSGILDFVKLLKKLLGKDVFLVRRNPESEQGAQVPRIEKAREQPGLMLEAGMSEEEAGELAELIARFGAHPPLFTEAAALQQSIQIARAQSQSYQEQLAKYESKGSPPPPELSLRFARAQAKIAEIEEKMAILEEVLANSSS